MFPVVAAGLRARRFPFRAPTDGGDAGPPLRTSVHHLPNWGGLIGEKGRQGQQGRQGQEGSLNGICPCSPVLAVPVVLGVLSLSIGIYSTPAGRPKSCTQITVFPTEFLPTATPTPRLVKPG